jgi:hypothetical protein
VYQFFILCSVLILAGCLSGPSVQSSNPRAVVIQDVKIGQILQAQVLADAECAKHNMYAVLIPGTGNTVAGRHTFECDL